MEMLRDEVDEITLKDPQEMKNTKPVEEATLISKHPNYPDRHVMIGTKLIEELRKALVEFFKKNNDVFAWLQGNVLRINSQIAIHKLFTNPNYSLVH